MSDKRIPGVTFHVTTSNIGQPTASIGGKKPKYVGNAVLSASVIDTKLWDEVVKKLDGLRIYTIDDFKGELISLLQEDVERLNAAVLAASNTLAAERVISEQRLSYAEGQERAALKLLAIARAELDRLRALETDIAALAETVVDCDHVGQP